ncbi:MAG: hydrogenase expression/formation protein HypE [Gammaproteobacteria bacterium]|nr:hydrogenase expression/formation protein HypE [Gammaproteobacteria bacterium]
MKEEINFTPSCPFPFEQYPTIVMAHGGGGRLMKRLLDEMVIPTLNAGAISEMHDAAVIGCPSGHRIAMTTDSFVVNPLQFPGGDIGCLSIYGTVNDLAMAGARPAYLSLGLIIEEGLEMKTLWRFLESMRNAAEECGVRIVTGDTKVVDRGKGDGLYVNTAGLGFVPENIDVRPHRIQIGDAVLVSGDLGRHGIAIMAQREGLSFDTTIESDCATLHKHVQALLDENIDIHCLRDLTRGGLSSALNELATATDLCIDLDETTIPVAGEVRAACELLGLDPLYVACEGRFAAFMPAAQAEQAKQILQTLSPMIQPQIIGKVAAEGVAPVILHNAFGGQRVLDMLSGEQLPRIC